jgi:S1-C subfamily serine protease
MPALRPRSLRLALLPLAAGLVLAACGGGGHKAATAATADATPASAPAPASLSALQTGFRHVVDTVSPSVVQIETDEGLGSGIVFDDKGDIVTNAHVVGSATTFRVTLVSGRRVAAKLVGRFAPGDLAVVHTDASGLRPARFADSSKLAVGDIAVAVGNPLGLRSSVTEGIVSSLGRTVSEGDGVTLPAAIQTSAPINPGNSGGALADIHGAVIGIPTLAATDPQLGGGQAPGIGFAIPSNIVTSIARQLVDSGHVTNSGRAALGLDVATMTQGGVVVVGVTQGGPADRAGVQRGDVIVSLDGKPTPNTDALATVLAGLKPGRHVTLAVRTPEGAAERHDVTLGQLSG